MLNIVHRVMKSMSLGINIESTNNKEWQNFFMAVKMMDMKPVWRTSLLYSSDRQSGLSTMISVDRRLHVSLRYQNLWLEKSDVGQLRQTA